MPCCAMSPPPISAPPHPSPVCSPPSLHLSDGRCGGLTHRSKLLTLLVLAALCLLTCVTAAAEQPGFLKDVLEANDRIRQQVSALASKNFQDDLSWVEVHATTRDENPDFASADFKRALQDFAIELSGAHGQTHTVFVKWKDSSSIGASHASVHRVGFYPPELQEAFLRKTFAASNSDGGLSLLGYVLQVLPVMERNRTGSQAEPTLRFYAPLPPGWTDEQLMQAMIEQGGLNFDHVRNFGLDLRRNTSCNAPTGDVFFNFDPAGCLNHGANNLGTDGETPEFHILQPPGRFFVIHPISGAENHIKLRKAGACQSCWGAQRHGPCIYKKFCRMCLIPWDDMHLGGMRHACGQGDIFRPKTAPPPKETQFKYPSWDNMPPPSSDLAAKLMQKQVEGIERAKRRHFEAADANSQHSQSGGDNFGDPEEDPEENQDQQPSKASKADAHDSPSRNQSENGSPKQ